MTLIITEPLSLRSAYSSAKKLQFCVTRTYIARVSTGYIYNRPNNKKAQLLLEKMYYSLFLVAVLTFQV